MNYFGDVNDTLNRIMMAFKSNSLPKSLAQAFITGIAEKHCASYSLMNRFIVILNGYSDARGYGQWKEIDRYVKAGEKGFAILAPVLKTISENKVNETSGIVEKKVRKICVGFKAVKVFGLEQTDGKAIAHSEEDMQFVASLPFKNVAEAWGIKVDAYNGKEHEALGLYSPMTSSIHLGTKNLSTWTHELAHAADDRLGTLDLNKRWLAEVSAELAGATLLQMIGKTEESDLGGCFDYITHYAKQNNIETIEACRMVLGRVTKIVEMIMSEAGIDNTEEVEKETAVA